jgi:uncharacterized cupin superfamily protein
MGKKVDIVALHSMVDTLYPPPFDEPRLAREDELVYFLSGEVVLVTNAGGEVLRAGDCAGVKAGEPDGHCLQNRGTVDATVLEIDSRIPGESTTHSGIDMKTEPGGGYVHKDGAPYAKIMRRGPG